MIRIVHAFPDLLNLYGGDADLQLLIRYLRASGEEVVVEPLAEETIKEANLLYFGAGTENKMLVVAKKLQEYKTLLQTAFEQGKQMLFVGSSAALPLQTITDLDGHTHSALGLMEGSATVSDKRVYTELVAECSLTEHAVIGAFNSSLVMETNAPAFLKIDYDADNKVGKMEGVQEKGLIATQLAAPLLVRNPALLDYYADRLSGKDLPDPQEPWYRHNWMGYVCAYDILKTAMHK